MNKIIRFCFLGSLISTSAFAISNEALALKCYEVGQQKVVEQAEAYGCEVEPEAVEVSEIDNRWYNPSKYIWYEVKGECNGYDSIIKLVQYYRGECH